MFPAKGRPVPRAVKLGENHGNACAYACDHKKKEVHHRARNAHSGKLRLPRKAAQNKRVRRVVKLLQDVAHHQRSGKAQQVPRNTAAGQILGIPHIITS